MGIFSTGCFITFVLLHMLATTSNSLLSGIAVDIDFENTMYIESSVCVECKSAGFLNSQTYSVDLTLNTTTAMYSPSSFCMTVYECFFSGASLVKVNISSANDSFTANLVPAFLSGLSLTFDTTLTIGKPCNLNASVSTGAGVTFTFNISHALNNTLLMKVFEPTNVTSNYAVLCFIPPYLGNYTIVVEASASCGQILNKTFFQSTYVPDSPIDVSIVGGSLRQAKIGSVVSLDAQSGLYNGDTVTAANTNFSFSWACYLLLPSSDGVRYTQPHNNDTSYRALQTCNLTIPAAGLVNISTSGFAVNAFALFEVTVRNKAQEGIAAQVVSILSTQPPLIAINCVWNCDGKVIPDDRTKFTGVIQECTECIDPKDSLEARYRWSISKYDNARNVEVPIPYNSWGPLITSAQDSNTLDIDGGWFLEGTTYTITLSINVSYFPEAKAVKSVFTNLKPYNGNCSVEPIEGIPSVTQFTFKFLGWKDEGTNPYRNPVIDSSSGLQYEVYQETAVSTQLVYSKGNSTSEGIFLSDCVGRGGICNMTVFVKDIYKAKTTCFFTVKVAGVPLTLSNNSSQTDENLANSLEFIEQLTSKVADSSDPLTAVRRAALFTTIVTSIADGVVYTTDSISSTGGMDLNPPEKSPAAQALVEAANNFVSTIGAKISGARIKDPVHLQTYANSLAIATSNTKYMSAESVSTASSALIVLTDIFRQKNLRIAEVLPCLSGFKDLIHNIINITAIDLSDFEPDLKSIKNSKPDLSDQEVKYLAQWTADYQKLEKKDMIKKADKTVGDLKKAWDDIFDVVKKLQDPKGIFETKKDTFTLQTVQKTKSELTKGLPVLGDESSKAPLSGVYVADVLVDSDAEVLQAQTVETKNIYIQGSNSKYITSNVFIGSVAVGNGTKLVIVKPQIVHELKENNCTNEAQVLQEISPKFILDDAAQMFYHTFEYPNPMLTLCIKVRARSSKISYTLYLRMGSEPTDLSFDLRKKLTRDMIGPCGEFCIPPRTFATSGRIYIGLKPELDETAKTKSSSGIQKRDALFDNLESIYLFGVTTLACFSWDPTINDWNPGLCKMNNINGSIICTCEDGREIVNGLSFSFQPSTIHFGTVFSKFDIQGQGLIIGVLLALYFIFLLTALWAHYMDKKSVFQWGVFPLSDNYADDNYFYLLTVHTGLRHTAGTKSKVSFCLSGEQDETGVRILSDGVREGLPAGSEYHFVMACPLGMGELQCLRIWHDNSGKGNSASWFLDRVDVIDIQTGRVSYFVCEEWLTPENNSLDKMIEASGSEGLDTLKSQFFSNTKKHITDDHLWVSLFIRPQRSRFSRVERAGCCLAFFLLAMITSAMFYVGAPDVNRKVTKVDFEMGPIRLKYQQLYFSFVSAIITAIPLVLIMMIFRKAKTRTEAEVWKDVKLGQVKKNCSKRKVTPSETSHVIQHKKTACCSPPWMHKLEAQLNALDQIMMLKPGVDDMKGTWPRSLRWLAWIIVAASVVVSSFFVILYTMEWGRDVSEEWLSTFFLAFVQSLCLVDPFKVLMFSVFLSIFMRKSNVGGVDQLNLKLIYDVNKVYGIKEKPNPPRIYSSFTSPLSEAELKAATLKRKIHTMIRGTLKEFVIHFVYLLIVSSVCYSNRSTNDYHMYKLVKNQLIGDTKSGFLSVNSSSLFFDWVKDNLTPWLFPETMDINRTIFPDKAMYTSSYDIYRLGSTRIRQLRMNIDDCVFKGIELKKCVLGYDITKEENRDYCLGWLPPPCSENSTKISFSMPAWKYSPAMMIGGLPIAGEYNVYGGGGYRTNLEINQQVVNKVVEELRKNFWIDRQTRSVFIEFTIYCPNLNRFAYVILLIEFLDTGGLLPFYSIYPFTVHDPPGILGMYLQVCELLGIVFTVVGVLYLVFAFGKKKMGVLKDFWIMLDLAAIILAICAASMYFLRLSYTKAALAKIKADRNQFINFYQVVVWDSSLMICLGLLIAIGCLRLLKLAGYSEKTMKVYHVLCLGVQLLPSFFMFIFLILVSFAFMGWILFGRTSKYFKNFWACLETLFTGLLGHSSFKETNVPESDQWISSVYFCGFVGIVVIFLTNFFLAVLMDLLNASSDRACKGDETKVFIMLWDLFLKSMGSKRDPTDRLKDDETELLKTTTNKVETLNSSPDDYAKRLSKNLAELCQDREADLMQWVERSERKQKSSEGFSDISFPKLEKAPYSFEKSNEVGLKLYKF